MNPADHLKPGFRLIGPTTRPTTLTSGDRIAFTKEALEQAVADINTGFMPMPVEHLSYLPPIGRVAEGELIEADGDFWLAIRDEVLFPGTSPDLTLPEIAAETNGEEDPAAHLSVALGTEPRNFAETDFAEIRQEAPSDIGSHALHSDLPPLIWSFSVGITGLGVLGAKAFVTEFCKQLGTDSATAFVDWLKSASSRAKEIERDQLASFRLETSTGINVLAFCPFNPAADETLTELASAISRITDVAAFTAGGAHNGHAANVRQIAFIWDVGAWHLAWWASDIGSFATPWLQANAPDPGRFLGGHPATLRQLQSYVPGLTGAFAPESLGHVDLPIADPNEPST